LLGTRQLECDVPFCRQRSQGRPEVVPDPPQASPTKPATSATDAPRWSDPHAASRLLPLVYEELRKPAAQRMAQEQPGQTLQHTAWLHEAY
jgi:hypothetical protein